MATTCIKYNQHLHCSSFLNLLSFVQFNLMTPVLSVSDSVLSAGQWVDCLPCHCDLSMALEETETPSFDEPLFDSERDEEQGAVSQSAPKRQKVNKI